MDFKSLNRRELQSLCKINKIPANITNVAMVDALKSLHTVVGIDDILNASRLKGDGSSIESSEKNEITSPKVPQTSIRTRVKKLETGFVLATASRVSRGVRRQLTGEGNVFMKTPSVSNARPKRPTTSTVKRETTVQSVYNTRRSARLTEKKCVEPCVTKRDISRPVKIASFLEEASVTSEISVGSDSSSLEASNESNTLFGITKYNVEEGSVENYDEGTSKEKVKDICIEFEKLDVVIKDGSDHSLVIEEGDCYGENVDFKDKHKVEKKFILNEPEASDEKGEQVHNIRPDSEGTSNLCDDGDSEENITVVDEKVDPYEASNASYMEHDDGLLCDKVLLGENDEKADCCETMNLEEKQKVEEKYILNDVETSKERNDQVEKIKQESEGISNPRENVDSEEVIMVVDEKYDLHEVLNDSVKEHVVAKEHYNNLLYDKVLFGGSSEEVDCYDENVDSGEKQKVDEMLISNEFDTFDKKGDQVDNMKQVSEGNSNSCEDEDLEGKLMVVDDNNDSHVELNVLVKEHLASEEHSVSLLCDTVLLDENNEKVDSCGENVDLEDIHKVEEKFILNEVETSEEKGDQVISMKQDSEDIFNPCENEDLDEKLTVADDKIDSHEELNVSIKQQFAPEEHYENLHYNIVLSCQNGVKVNCCDENATLEEKQNVEDKFNSNGVETSEDKNDQVDIIKPYSEGISNPSEGEDLKEELMVFDEKIDPYEALNVSANEPTIYLVSEEHTNNLLYDKVLSDGSDAYSISYESDTENLSDSFVHVSEIKKKVSKSHGFTNNNKNLSDQSELDNAVNHSVANKTTAKSGEIEENVSAKTVDVNSNEEEPRKDFEASHKPHVSLIKETVVNTMATIYQETEENHFSTNADDAINHPTPLTPIKNETLCNNSTISTKETIHVSNINETSLEKVQVEVVECDRIINKEGEDEKPPISIRQLKKQLKALSIKGNLNTNKDD